MLSAVSYDNGGGHRFIDTLSFDFDGDDVVSTLRLKIDLFMGGIYGWRFVTTVTITCIHSNF